MTASSPGQKLPLANDQVAEARAKTPAPYLSVVFFMMIHGYWKVGIGATSSSSDPLLYFFRLRFLFRFLSVSAAIARMRAASPVKNVPRASSRCSMFTSSLCVVVIPVYIECMYDARGSVGTRVHDERMHQITDISAEYDRDDRLRVGWECACGSKGSGLTRQAAQTAYKRHVRTANRKEYGL